ncbi:hypothetical protein C8A03DRAFT_19593, partial [Achaetomium macrosporum]
GLPCTPGFVLTDYKWQGKTLEKAVLGMFNNQNDNRKDFSISPYVQLSRCTSTAGLTLLERLDEDNTLRQHPPEHIVECVGALEQRSQEIIQAWQSRESARDS